jgi:hypothetical protein
MRSPVPSSKSKKGKVVGLEDDSSEDDGVPKFKKQFNRFHEENGVRTVIGSIGSAQNGRLISILYDILNHLSIRSSHASETNLSAHLYVS